MHQSLLSFQFSRQDRKAVSWGTQRPLEFATEWDLLAEEASLLRDVTTYAVGTAVPVRPND